MITTIQVNIGPAKFKCHIDNDDDLQAEIRAVVNSGVAYEPDTTMFVLDQLEPGDCFFDVGAHMGWFTLLAASVVGPNGRVVAYEPTDVLYHDLLYNVSLNKFNDRVICIKAAVGNHVGETTFWMNADHSGGGAIWDLSKHPYNPKSKLHERKISVDMHRLDDDMLWLQDECGISRIKCVKIDVEGAEVEVLRGADTLLREHRIGSVVAEANGVGLSVLGQSRESMDLLMDGYGYDAFVTDENIRLSNGNHIYNVLYLPKEGACQTQG